MVSYPAVDEQPYMYYNPGMTTMPDEPRKITTIRLKPSAQRRAKIAAVTAGVTLGQWLEAAIQQKIEREGGQNG